MKTGSGKLSIGHLVAACGAAATLLVIGPAGAQARSDIGVTVNGEPVLFQGLGPQQINGRTMVPVRGVLEKLGADISYNNATQTVTASTPTMDIQLKIGSRTAIVNANPVTLDVPAQMIQDHTFVPLRFLGESLGADLKWDSATRTVVITTKDALSRDTGIAGNNDRARDRVRDRDRDLADNPDRARDRQRDRDRDRDLTDNDRTRDRDRDRDVANNDRTRDRDRDRRRDTDVPVSNGVAPVINSFTVNSGKWLRSGQTLEATMEATPGGDASFRIPGLAEDIPMHETRPGHYVGSWLVPENKQMQLRSAAVIGSLKIGSRTAPLLQAGEMISVDAVPPRARDMTPENNAIVAEGRPNISAVFEDRGSGIDQSAVRLSLDAKDITDRATVTRGFISFKPDVPLRPGLHEAELTLADMAGNLKTTSWVFTVRRREEAGIRTVTDTFDSVLQPGDMLRVELTGTPGGRATFSSGSLRDIPMMENQPGHYVGEYRIRRGDDIAGQPIVYHLLTPDGQRFEQSSGRTVRIATGRPLAPIITAPVPNDAPRSPLIIRGKAAPNARVAVRVDYRNRVLGLIALQGTAADTVVTADRNGNWETEPINLGGILGSRGVEYTITATAMNAFDERSDTTTLRLRQ